MARAYTILVVDDDPELLEIYSAALAQHRHFVLTAKDGYEAIRVLVERNIDLLIADIVMPGLTGPQLAAQAKLMRPGIHVMYVTGVGAAPDRTDVSPLGRILRKPVRVAELVAAVQQEMMPQ